MDGEIIGMPDPVILSMIEREIPELAAPIMPWTPSAKRLSAVVLATSAFVPESPEIISML